MQWYWYCPVDTDQFCQFTSSCDIVSLYLYLLSISTPGASLVAQRVKRPPAMRETPVRSLERKKSPGEGNSSPLQYSCLETPMDGEAWQGHSPCGRKELDTTEKVHFYFRSSDSPWNSLHLTSSLTRFHWVIEIFDPRLFYIFTWFYRFLNVCL